MTVLWSVNPDDELRIPLPVPAWLVLSDVSAHAVRLYCLYQLALRNYRRPSTHLPQGPDDLASVLQIDVEQYLSVHQELLDIGAVEEAHDVDEAGEVESTLVVHELSPTQRVEADRRERWRQEQLAERRAAEEASRRTAPAAEGFVYVIAQVGTTRVKIGYTRNVARRLKGLQTSNPYKLEVLWHAPGDMRLEEALHKKFAKRRTQGEWFDFGHLNPVKAVEAALSKIKLHGGAESFPGT
ncbi:GIY-YIG nuclease family protein [Allokutzneria sp. NRRL B-24872]|uniref:GIY-YIG nuclease family protein n=1 Tax=Allokutzneria sp. NRRL B-24872 TaxID=1137961 RepID=UPI00143D8135|nr:GIY-YIG nuclease family protein [Allokutzneria sp. NRRL B-24872]